MKRKDHWEAVYGAKQSKDLSWYQPDPARSLSLIEGTGLPKTARIIDAGGGDSTLVDHLVAHGYRDITVLDLSKAALDRARERLGKPAAGRVSWLEGDVLDVDLPPEHFDLWHDRAVFHFLTGAEERQRYIEQVERAVRPGGHVIVATFADDGPTRCSGLPVARYSASELHDAFGFAFRLIESQREMHHTPFGAEQSFTYCWCRYEPVHARA